MSLQKQNDNVNGDHTKQMTTTMSVMSTRNRRRSHLSVQQCEHFPRLLLLLLAGAVLINISLAQTTTATAAIWLRHKKVSQGTSVYETPTSLLSRCLCDLLVFLGVFCIFRNASCSEYNGRYVYVTHVRLAHLQT